MPAALSGDLLTVYLNDHLGGATFGRELADRAAGANRDTEFGAPLASLAGEIRADREELVAIIRRLGRSQDPLKVSTAWVTEKVGRLKPNGRVLTYSPLSRLLELEALAAGVEGKLALWRALRTIAPTHPELDEQHLEQLVARAERQRSQLADLQARAAELALSHGAGEF